VIVTVLVPSTAHPSGGVLGIAVFANGLVRRGHEVDPAHVPFPGPLIPSGSELSWCTMEPTSSARQEPGYR